SLLITTAAQKALSLVWLVSFPSLLVLSFSLVKLLPLIRKRIWPPFFHITSNLPLTKPHLPTHNHNIWLLPKKPTTFLLSLTWA
ncbi:hypothetical protein BDF14DRAFT_1860625, partial [Spinellus fusiger]